MRCTHPGEVSAIWARVDRLGGVVLDATLAAMAPTSPLALGMPAAGAADEASTRCHFGGFRLRNAMRICHFGKIWEAMAANTSRRGLIEKKAQFLSGIGLRSILMVRYGCENCHLGTSSAYSNPDVILGTDRAWEVVP